jgi:hypothetical protein
MPEQQQSWKSIVNAAYQAIVNQRRKDQMALRAVYSIIEDSVADHDKQSITLEGDTLLLVRNGLPICRLRVDRGDYIIAPSGDGEEKRVTGQIDALRAMGQLMAEAMDDDLQQAKAAA